MLCAYSTVQTSFTILTRTEAWISESTIEKAVCSGQRECMVYCSITTQIWSDSKSPWFFNPLNCLIYCPPCVLILKQSLTFKHDRVKTTIKWRHNTFIMVSDAFMTVHTHYWWLNLKWKQKLFVQSMRTSQAKYKTINQ